MRLDNFPKILWINLDGSSNRRKNMETLLNGYGLDHTRISAIDGTNKELMEKVCNPKTTISLLENACTCSHILALKYFIETMEDDKVIIFEDDVSFEFLEFIPYDWSTLEKYFPTNYDMVQLAVSHHGSSRTHLLVKIYPYSKYFCSAAYLITRKAAKELVSKYITYSGKINLSDKKYATADAMITSISNSYSIAIFTYQTNESIIHPNHLEMHYKSKLIQRSLWKSLSDSGSQIDWRKYFDLFPKK